MSNEHAEGEQPRHDPLAALRQRNFQLYSGSRIFGTLAQQMLQAVMAWQLYELTGDPFSLGFLGLARFLPALCASLIGGTVADTYDRRKIMMGMMVVPFSCGAILATATASGWASQALIYGLVVCVGLASAFEAPARTALLPSIVKPETFANAVTVNNIFQKLGSISGLAMGGGIIAVLGIAAAYTVFCTCLFLSAMPLLLIKYAEYVPSGRRITLAAITEGVAFVRGHQVILGSMSLDLFAVIFGGAATALLPIYARDILDAGGAGYGLLAASLQIGAFVTSLAIVMLPPVKRTGRALVITVIAYGLVTIAFGLSRNLYLSIVLYGLIGATDQVSVVMRQTTIQMATPNELRGRVSSVHQVFVQASNQLGAAEAGFVAGLTTATFAVVSGGAIASSVAAFIGLRMPLLYHYQLNRMALAQPPEAGETDVKGKRDALPIAGGGS